MLVSEGLIALIVATISAIATILSVGLAYVWSKKKEVGANIRQRKQEMYDDLVQCITTLRRISIYTDVNAVNDFIMAYYKASAYASDDVIDACSKFLALLEKSETDSGKLTQHISNVYNAIRQDINPKAKSFNFRAFGAALNPSPPPQTNQPPT